MTAPNIQDVATLEAREDLRALFEAMYAHFAAVGGRALLAESGYTAWTAYYAKTAGRSRLVVEARDDTGRAIGFAEALLRSAPAHLGGGVTGFVAHLYVDPAHRGGPVARALVDRMRGWFTERGVRLVELQIVHGNAVADRFWRGLGFQPDLQQMRLTLD